MIFEWYAILFIIEKLFIEMTRVERAALLSVKPRKSLSIALHSSETEEQNNKRQVSQALNLLETLSAIIAANKSSLLWIIKAKRVNWFSSSSSFRKEASHNPYLQFNLQALCKQRVRRFFRRLFAEQKLFEIHRTREAAAETFYSLKNLLFNFVNLSET